MRSLLIASAVLGLVVSGTAGAQYTDRMQVTSVADAKVRKDDSWVLLEGYIIERLRDEHYKFRDDTGEIEVEIDDALWKSRTVGPETKVRLHGEIDQDWRSVELDVDRIEIVE